VPGVAPSTSNPSGGPRYVNSAGSYACQDGTGNAVACNPGNVASSYVGDGFIPVGAALLEAVGVQVGSSRTWTPFFVGSLVGSWTAGATATAKGGYAAGGPSGTVFPAGIADAFFTGGRVPCSGPATTDVGGPGACDPQYADIDSSGRRAGPD
jgi:hypothetical protein